MKNAKAAIEQSVNQAGEKEEEEMNKEDLQKMLDETIAPPVESLQRT